MNSRSYDILTLLGAVLIVIIIAVVMKPNLLSDTFGGQDEPAEVVATNYPENYDMPAVGINESGYLSYQNKIITKEDQMWLLSSRISDAMDYYQPDTRNFAARYIPADNSGEFNIAHACDIWDGVKDEWIYQADAAGIWDLSSASRTVNTGLKGDSNDFAIFIASLIKAVGGQARIKVAQSPQIGEHTYAELYLGNSGDFNTKMINSQALSDLKLKYPYAFSNDPSGLNVFKYESGEICSGESCWIYVKPFMQILNEPEKYGEICYDYPIIIEYLLLFPDSNVIDFQIMYLKFRYSGYSTYSPGVYSLREISYSSEYEQNGDKTYWLKLDWLGNYPGDNYYNDLDSAKVFYSDSSWDDIRFKTL
ncbi:MAG: hypothetical protein JXQ82_08240 [Methanomicrobiaceae archaeon]|nr:hypothetical protein [Methanomicrobiaceae archaeon]